MRKQNKYFNSIRSLVLPQIVFGSVTQTSIWLVAALSYSDINKHHFVLVFKLVIALPIHMFQLFIVCYLFGNLNEKKKSISDALYNSNWTEMDMKSKKLILFAMKMNDAHNTSLKFTYNKIVNMEIFAAIMRFCYSMFSMILNYKNNVD